MGTVTRKVEKHKKGWAAVEISQSFHLTTKTVLQVYPTKKQAEEHWDLK